MIELAFLAAYVALLAAASPLLEGETPDADIDQLRLELDIAMQDLAECQEAHRGAVENYTHFDHVRSQMRVSDPALDALCDNLAAGADYFSCLVAIRANIVEKVEREIARTKQGLPSGYDSLFRDETAPLQEKALELEDRVNRLQKTFDGLLARGVRPQDDRVQTVVKDQTDTFIAVTDILRKVCQMEGIPVPAGFLPGPVQFP